jgi:predicted kinase
MEMLFKTWFESSSVRDAILGVVSGGDELGDEEKAHLLARKTTDFSSSIKSRLKGLGVIKSLPKSTRPDIIRAVDDGVTVAELIKMASSKSISEGRYESEMDAMARGLSSRYNYGYDHRRNEPEHMRTPAKFAEHLRKKGLSEDEIDKAVAARFGIVSTESAEQRVLVIMRGVSGSGKSTVARSIAKERGGVVLSTDDYFERDGRYEFDPKMLPRYHAMNQARAEAAMARGVSPVIIDNTNTQAWEMKPYVEAAMKHGYEVEMLEPGSPGFPEVDFDEIMRRQRSRTGGKSMPEEVAHRMMSRFQKGLSVDGILASKSPFDP